MTTLTTRASKTTDLTHNELDANFNTDSVPVATTPFNITNIHNNSMLECSGSADVVNLPDASTISTTSSSSGSDTGEFTVWIRNDTATTLSIALTTAGDTLDGSAGATDDLDIGESKGFKLNNTNNGYVSFANTNPLEVTTTATQTLTNKTLTSPILTTPQLNDTSADHQYITAVSELAADRTVTMPLLTGNDEFVFKAHTQTLTNKTITSPLITAATGRGQTISVSSASTKTWTADTTYAAATGSLTLNTSTYEIRGMLQVTSFGGGNIKLQFNPSGVTIQNWGCRFSASTSTEATNDPSDCMTESVSEVNLTQSGVGVVEFYGFLRLTSGTTLNLQAAQLSSNASALVIVSSYLLATEV